jgi:hypothetical protein
MWHSPLVRRSGRGRREGAVVVLLAATVLAACGGEDGGETRGDEASEGSLPSAASDGWTLTVYYTAVEEYHDELPVAVTGCPELDCVDGDTALGSYPADFVAAVEAEGTGRITSGSHAGDYLNWSYDVGFWLDRAPRDSHGDGLEPFVTAAADAEVLAAGSRLAIDDCGELEEGGAPADDLCRQLRAADWVVADEFTPGLGGARHVDLYVGEETGPAFTDGELYTTLVDARLVVEEAEAQAVS